ncbi:hypothetical protein CMV_021970 [Castanea mollissima]|uniref:Uncharacterized protein n=1 Tax=Castanea mollissima TaxID=60419 RepID=A0A8J4QKB9_9ROSI|nr:hypothetical protein CMV_021970 [Castanea mollissima]
MSLSSVSPSLLSPYPITIVLLCSTTHRHPYLANARLVKAIFSVPIPTPTPTPELCSLYICKFGEMIRVFSVKVQKIRHQVLFLPERSALEEEVVDDEEYEDAKATWDDDEVKDPRGLEQGEQYPPLEIVEPHKKRTDGEHQIVSFKDN